MRPWLRLKNVCGPAALAVIAATLLLAVPPGRAADPVFPPASRIGLAPPPGFSASPNFLGFQHDDKQATILMVELPGYAYESIQKEVEAELKKDQAGTATRTDVTLKDGRGFILFAKPTSPQGIVLKWTMVANVSNATAIVTVMIPEAVQEVASDEAVRDSLTSLAVRTVPVEEQLAALPFSLSQLAGFRLVRVQPGAAAMLTDGPSDGIETSEQPLLLISIMQASTHPQAAERDGFARRLLGEIPGLKEVRVTRSEPMRVAGQQGHEVLVEAKDAKTDKEVNAVQWLRFGSGTLLRVIGVARKEGWPDTFRRFREVRDGIGPK